jgi:hypothetical protein
MTPYHTPPDTAATTGTSGTIQLEALLDSTPTGCKATKQVVVYLDHLARDSCNFGASQFCYNGTWTTPFGCIVMNSVSRTWNCHGSSLHAYNGTGNGYSDDLSFLATWGSSAHLNYPFSEQAMAEINAMGRGDIVTYHDSVRGVGHSATSLGGELTWGANNAPMKPVILIGNDYIPTSDSMQWATATVSDCAADFAFKWPKTLLSWNMNYIIIHKRP